MLHLETAATVTWLDTHSSVLSNTLYAMIVKAMAREQC